MSSAKRWSFCLGFSVLIENLKFICVPYLAKPWFYVNLGMFYMYITDSPPYTRL